MTQRQERVTKLANEAEMGTQVTACQKPSLFILSFLVKITWRHDISLTLTEGVSCAVDGWHIPAGVAEDKIPGCSPADCEADDSANFYKEATNETVKTQV